MTADPMLPAMALSAAPAVGVGVIAAMGTLPSDRCRWLLPVVVTVAMWALGSVAMGLLLTA